MTSSSSPLPYLPLEVKNDILRFCDPSTLARTAQVSLAFLELSSPILYEDVHIHGFEGLKLLFSKRTQPPSLQTAPFLSLSQIRELSIDYTFEDLEQDDYSDMAIDRVPSDWPLPVPTLEIYFSKPSIDQTTAPPLELVHLGPFLNPLHLMIGALRETGASVVFDPTSFSSLNTILLIEVLVASEPLGELVERAGWTLSRVTFDLPGGYHEDFEEFVDSMLQDLPLPEPAEVLVLAQIEEDKERVLELLRAAVEDGAFEDPDAVMAQVKVEVSEHPFSYYA